MPPEPAPWVRLRALASRRDWDLAEALRLPDAQREFTAAPSRWRGAGAGLVPCLVEHGDEVVGFLVLDRSYHLSHSFAAPGELGVRGLLIDAARQRRGLGVAAARALPGPLLEEGWRGLCLTVNRRNPGAYRCYLAAGFADAGELYLGGPAGPQHVLRKPLAGAGGAG
ncbi:GNAT family N-acetyltransferase [Stenotrophomonas sp. MMGLT7]|uniref:GNAT family N-acetyltransferase n=1 Tax=Stenotrophomonas sp. MMGLT7 TaxID=2901227 RepID=UPI0022B231F6|nr:GNAT family N-acetyltransferase [Stenotrophomonas sp. MMGLT7]